MDSGASSHITNNPGTIEHPLPSSFINTIFVGNGQVLPIKGSGHDYHHIPTKTYQLKNIQYSPQIVKNLLSVQKFKRDNNVSLEFDPFSFTLKDLKTNKPLSRHNSTKDLYPFTPPQQVLLTTSAPTKWHQRLGHPGALVLDFLIRNLLIDSLKNQTLFLCHSCQLSNRKRLPIYDSNFVTYSPFDIIHCDLWMSPVTSNSGYKYYMVLIDNHTQFVWIYPLKFKSKMFSNFVKFHHLINTQFNRNIKAFHYNLGGEFDNNNFKTFAYNTGLVFRFSCPHTFSQNGKTERMIRRLNDRIRALLIDAHLPPSFWVEALHTSAYLHNILPSK